MQYPIYFLLLIFTITPLCGQIVNIEEQRKVTDTTGFAGSAGIAGSYFKNKDRIFQLSIDSDIQFKHKKDLYLLLGQYNILQSNETNFNESAFLHFRYNKKINKLLRWEAFTQLQYNKINKINLRWLIGTGPRFKLIDNKWFTLYLGIIPMYEYENLDSELNEENRDFRLSNYISFSLRLSKKVKLTSTTYFQSLLHRFKDTRILSENELKVDISTKLSLKLTYLVAYDPFPVVDVPTTQVRSEIGIEYTF